MSTVDKAATRRTLLAWLPAGAYMALIWTLSSMPLVISFAEVPFKDKGVHMMEYGVLAALGAFAIRNTWPALSLLKVLLAAVLLTFAWGFLDELHQAFVPNRNSDVMDLLADTIGALVGSASFGALDRVWRGSSRS